MAVEKHIDPEVVRILSATSTANCRVVITLTAAAEAMRPEALGLSKAQAIDGLPGLPGLITAELTARDLASLEASEAVQAIDLDSEQHALA